MENAIARIEFPELLFGIVSPVGADTEPTIRALTTFLSREAYQVVPIKVTDYFPTIAKTIPPKKQLERFPTDRRIATYIEFGNQIRETFEDNSVLAAYSIFRISKERRRILKSDGDNRYQKVAYILYQFKRKEEIDLLRSVYGKLFFQIFRILKAGVQNRLFVETYGA